MPPTLSACGGLRDRRVRCDDVAQDAVVAGSEDADGRLQRAVRVKLEVRDVAAPGVGDGDHARLARGDVDGVQQAGERGVDGFDQHDLRLRGDGVRPLDVQRGLAGPLGAVLREARDGDALQVEAVVGVHPVADAGETEALAERVDLVGDARVVVRDHDGDGRPGAVVAALQAQVLADVGGVVAEHRDLQQVR